MCDGKFFLNYELSEFFTSTIGSRKSHKFLKPLRELDPLRKQFRKY